MPEPDGVLALADRLSHRKLPYQLDGQQLTVRDPWENRVLVRGPGG